jgi:hypothetical protein
MKERDWMTDAACTTVSPEIFFPDPTVGWAPNKHAAQVCASCPVQRQCLEDAPTWDQWSIRAGMTATARARLRRAA